MPIYEYQCPECANIFEEWAKASEMKDVAPCPLCQTPSERIISHTAFVLKGGGWYVTDYGYRKNISEGSATEGAAGSAAPVPAAAVAPSESTHATGAQESPAPKAESPAAAAPATPKVASGTATSAAASSARSTGSGTGTSSAV